MTTSEFETDPVRPVEAHCDQNFLLVALADGRQIRAPLWFFPFLADASADDRAAMEREFAGVWWPAVDEGISVKGLLLGWKAPGAVLPSVAAE
jgi:hypothetical protein